jgi:hypothetical protein
MATATDRLGGIDIRRAALGALQVLGAVFGAISVAMLYAWLLVLINDLIATSGVEFGPDGLAMVQALLLYPWVGVLGAAAANAASVTAEREYDKLRWAKISIGVAVLGTGVYLWLLDFGVVPA